MYRGARGRAKAAGGPLASSPAACGPAAASR
jgi:hypothetical protein